MPKTARRCNVLNICYCRYTGGYMKTEELTALGLNEDQVKQVFALNGKDV